MAETIVVNGDPTQIALNEAAAVQIATIADGVAQAVVTSDDPVQIAIDTPGSQLALVEPASVQLVLAAISSAKLFTAQNVSYTTASLAASASADFTIAAGTTYALLSTRTSTPAWARFYGTSAARAADTRTSPGGTVPSAGTDYYAELVTVSNNETIRLSPVPIVQAMSGLTYLRVKNTDSVSRAIVLDFSVITLES